MNRQQRRHPIHPLLPVPTTFKKSVINNKIRNGSYVSPQPKRRGRKII